MQSVKIVALIALFLCAFSVYEAEAQYYAPGYAPGYAWPYASYAYASYLNPYGRYYAYAPGYAYAPAVIGKRSAGFGPSEHAPMMEQHAQ